MKHKLKYILPSVVILAWIICSVWTQHGGFLLYGEADLFLIDHNSQERSFLSKVLCPHRHDAENYMARELGHLVEHVDAVFIHWCVMNGVPHFMSITNYLFLGGAGLLFWFEAMRGGMNKINALLLMGLFYSAPVVFMSGNYVRSGHAAATFLALWLVVLLARGETRWRYAFPITMTMVWVDRQGLFAAISIWLVYFVLTRKDFNVLKAVPVIAAVCIHTFHYVFIGPWLIHHFTPFTDVVIPVNPLAVSGANKGQSFMNFIHGWYIALSNLRFLCGSIPLMLAAFLAVKMAMLLKSRWWVVLATIGLISVMNAIILGAAKSLMWDDCLPSIYYHLIGTAIIWILVSISSTRMVPNVATWILVALVMTNISMLPSHVRGWKSGHLQGFIAGAPFIRQALLQTTQRMYGTSTARYNTLESCQFTGWNWIMKNPLEYGGRLSAQEFVESSQYLQFVRSEMHYPFGRGGRGNP